MKMEISKEWLLKNISDDEPGCIGIEAYDAWFSEVIKIAVLLGWMPKAIESIDKEAWKSYFNDGYTPSTAWDEEYDSAK